MIFQLEDDIKADLYLLRLADDTKHVIDLSRAEVALNNLHAHEKEKCSEDYFLVGRGAQRRGTEGVFSTYSNAENDSRIIGASDVGMCWKGAADSDGSDYASKYITVEGDCGMIIFDGNGDPLSMHHAGFETTGTEPIMYESYSVPLIHIIKAHQNFFPDVTVSEDYDNSRIRQSSPKKQTSRLVPQIDPSFLAKHKPKYKKRPGVLKLNRVPRIVTVRELQDMRREQQP